MGNFWASILFWLYSDELLCCLGTRMLAGTGTYLISSGHGSWPRMKLDQLLERTAVSPCCTSLLPPPPSLILLCNGVHWQATVTLLGYWPLFCEILLCCMPGGSDCYSGAQFCLDHVIIYRAGFVMDGLFDEDSQTILKKFRHICSHSHGSVSLLRYWVLMYLVLLVYW